MGHYSLETARSLDQVDSLRHFADRFYRQPGQLYFDGNSLGLLSKDAEKSLLHMLDEWKTLGINGWMDGNPPWFYMAEHLAARQAGLVGALEHEVVMHSSTTVNLHALLSTFYKPTRYRDEIVMDELNFPSDHYAVRSFLNRMGKDPDIYLRIVPSRNGRTLEESDIINAMTNRTALVLLPSVLYRSGQLLDMALLTSAVHENGSFIGFDMSHSAGAIPHHLHDQRVDFAFWCTYKYMNSGPGGVSTLFVHEQHHHLGPGLAGWFGCDKKKQFDMDLSFTPSPCAGAWQIGTPHLLSMAPLAGSLDIFEEAGIINLRQKSLAMTDFLMRLIDERLAEHHFTIGTPRDSGRRGGHVALEHEEAVRINEALKARGVIPDFRYPNNIRLAPMALYNSFEDIWLLVDILKEIMDHRLYEQYENKRGPVA